MTALRLLLVDDEPLILAAFKRGLRARGYDVTTACGAETALASASTTAFDLVILDIRMPGMSGLELGRLLRERYGLACIYLTAIGDDEFVGQAVQEGALTYLVKPIDIAQLIPVIEAALVRAREIRALFEQKAHLDHALIDRRHTSLAIGILMERHRLTERQAFENLRAEARRRRRKLEDYCDELITCLEADVVGQHAQPSGPKP